MKYYFIFCLCLFASMCLGWLVTGKYSGATVAGASALFYGWLLWLVMRGERA